ncbi:MAG: hypothetical protein CFE32_06470 [Alphaproteobacteria bacterium PA3]|nr:MAG: hypothetical protein CFE32_06470 [Alphaproteobacteria bacterium PA3]
MVSLALHHLAIWKAKIVLKKEGSCYQSKQNEHVHLTLRKRLCSYCPAVRHWIWHDDRIESVRSNRMAQQAGESSGARPADKVKAGNRAFAVIMAILASLYIGQGIYILSEIAREGFYTIHSRNGPVDITGLAAILYGLGKASTGTALMGTMPYLLLGRVRLSVLIGGAFGLLAIACLLASLLAR